MNCVFFCLSTSVLINNECKEMYIILKKYFYGVKEDKLYILYI